VNPVTTSILPTTVHVTLPLRTLMVCSVVPVPETSLLELNELPDPALTVGALKSVLVVSKFNCIVLVVSRLPDPSRHLTVNV